ncbi:MAG TPA: zinc ribbon domain-containing protein [Phycisphaerae bacterium]|nr:zinc ribbon domain-containing protein [Phycisphaerae bacterium]HNU46596.1 zinc ribbon domain-containing protein [Phycisphaerae bacterium]
MPIYEYICTACRHEFEELARTMAARKPKCPSCGSGRVERKFSAFAARRGVEGAGGGCFDHPGCDSCCAGGTCPMGDD